jgi:peptide/nickel transport system substrate-binding protein
LKNKFTWLGLSFLLVAAMLLASCSKATTTSTTTKTTTSTTTTKTTTTQPITTTSATTTTTASGNWWDKNPQPQTGGTMTIRTDKNFVGFDPYSSSSQETMESAWLERLFSDNWTIDPSVFNFSIQFRPSEFLSGQLAKSYEFTDPGTLVIQLQQGVHWQNIPPLNGREFVAADVVYHYDRLWGMGDGFTTPSPFQVTDPVIQTLTSITATGNYTVTFKFSLPNPEAIFEVMTAVGDSTHDIEASDAVNLWGDLTDWHHAIGTGPFILKDFVAGDSATLTRNPNYWGVDERYPQNHLPYIDTLRYIIMPDSSTAFAALRAGKVDILDSVAFQQAQQIKKTNPEITQVTQRFSDAYTIDARVDKAPFTDIRVRQAMQKAINLQSIASDYFQGTADPWPSTLTSNYMTGWGYPYSQWPQALKDQYAFNVADAKALMAAANLSAGFHTTIVVDINSDMNLLQIVQDEFKAINITMTVTTKESTDWLMSVLLGHTQDGLAYHGGIGGGLGHTFAPIQQFNIIKTGFIANYWGIADPAFDALGAQALASSTVDGVKQAVADANKLIAEKQYIVSLLQPNLFGFAQPWVNGYAGQYCAISSVSGPRLNGFYMSRFWIDQTLKTHLGH